MVAVFLTPRQERGTEDPGRRWALGRAPQRPPFVRRGRSPDEPVAESAAMDSITS